MKKKDQALESLKESSKETTRKIAAVQPDVTPLHTVTSSFLDALEASQPVTTFGEAEASEIALLNDAAKAIAERLDTLKERARMEMPGEERKYIKQYGPCIVEFTRKMTTRMDYEAYIVDQLGPSAEQEIASIKKGDIESKFAKTTESVSVSVRRVS